MEGLKILIRNLAFILLLATFLEMLLPNKSMRGFVQLVMGLFVIAAILSPLTDFLKLDFSDEVPAWVVAAPGDMPVLAGESELEDTGKSAVREQYKRILINQMNIFVSALEGIEDTDIGVELEENAGGFADYPQILKVEIVFSQSQSGVKPIEPVIIGESSDEEQDNQETSKALEIQGLVSAFMQIPREIVVVRERM
ncbi:MAG: hypothetical protein APF84_14345 [Gracilibacter sp. BRH_c7a]|nr:MAG: hypothetical protein APF84_14345 [Gracilibacter sp. BRH_c7a]